MLGNVCYNVTFEGKIGKIGASFGNRLEFWSSVSPVPEMKLFFTSEKNSYGVTLLDWRDGKVFRIETPPGYHKEIDLAVEKYVYLNGNDQSFYECFATKVLSKITDQCNTTCLPVTLPQDQYSICEKSYIDDNTHRPEVENNMKIPLHMECLVLF